MEHSPKNNRYIRPKIKWNLTGKKYAVWVERAFTLPLQCKILKMHLLPRHPLTDTVERYSLFIVPVWRLFYIADAALQQDEPVR